MAILKIDETQIPENYSHALYNEKEYDLAAEHTSKILDVIVNGVSNCLADVKSKDYPVAFTFKEANGDLIAAAVVEYHPSDDKSMPGNWSYIWTFDEKDIPEKENKNVTCNVVLKDENGNQVKITDGKVDFSTGNGGCSNG